MDLQDDPVAIISSACRLPLGVTDPSQLWDAFCRGNSKDVFSALDLASNPRSSSLTSFIDSSKVGGAGWLGKEGIESFDPAFFNMSPADAEVLRPNTRLALELTWEVLERAGIPPSSVRGTNVALSIGMGTEDGWDLHRVADDGREAFDHRWAANSDPSGVSGQVSRFFDFRGPSFVISTACSSGAFALRDGIQALVHEECNLAVVGAITTHFSTAPIDWAASVNVASKKGQCAAFSSEADGYVPSEGAVFFVLKRASAARASTNPILGIIRSLSTGHNGATRALATPNVVAQAALTRRSLRAAHLVPSDVDILEAHGTGTRLGDAMEAEGVRAVYDNDEERRHPLWVSSSKTLFGHCQAAAILVGILKILTCFEHKALPPHLVEPLQEFKTGGILIPTTLTTLPTERPLIAQISSFGFTGSIASLILEEPSKYPSQASQHTVMEPFNSPARPYILPFSARTKGALDAQIKAVYKWACQTHCSLHDLGTILTLCRDHHSVRRAIVASDLHDLWDVNSAKVDIDEIAVTIDSSFLNLSELPESFSNEDKKEVDDLVRSSHILKAGCLLYNKGRNLRFEEIYDHKAIPRLHAYLRTFPTYTFDRKVCWRNVARPAEPTASPVSEVRESRSVPSRLSHLPSMSLISETIASILHISVDEIHPSANIFDLGIDSLNSIELAGTLSKAFGISLPILELYSLLNVQAIYNFFIEKNMVAEESNKARLAITHTQSRREFSQADVDAWVAKYGAPLDTSLAPIVKEERSSNAVSVLLTGANGMLGCHLLHVLLSRAEIARVFCLVRGDAWDRMSRAYAKHGYDSVRLVNERDAGRILVFRTSDLGDKYLGCGKEVYERLLQDVDTIVHLAWKLDFNLPTPAFRNCIEGTRTLAQLCVDAKKEVAYYFISSFSSYFGYKDELVPEEPLTADLGACMDQGYAISKLIAEHALLSIFRSSNSGDTCAFDLRLVRVGQICGDSTTGDWSLNEMKPMLIQALPALKIFPRNMPDISWIPSDICATTIAELILSPATAVSSDEQPVLHVANPTVTPWPDVARMLGKLAGFEDVPLVSLKEYYDAVRNSANRSDLPITRLLPYLASVLEKEGDFPSKYASLGIKKSLAYSNALASCPEIDEKILFPIVKSLLGKTKSSNGPAVATITPIEPPVLLFGPWSGIVQSINTQDEEVEKRVRTTAVKTRDVIGYNSANKSLDSQLATLISQLSAFEDLKRRSIVPRAVLGYCYGEYAASVCAGILTLETAVDIIVRRAAALHGINGSMLNVFAELIVVKRQLFKLPFILQIAIHAGPKHYVISGPPDEIASAQLAFNKAGIKTKLIETSIPFHSALMDNTIRTLQLPAYKCNSESCVYVSGVTGRAISGIRLGPKYWLRHMRDPVLFVDAVRFIRGQYTGSLLVDVGPGRMLSSIVARYEWDGCQVVTLDKFLSGETPPPVKSSKTDISPSSPAPVSQPDTEYQSSQASDLSLGKTGTAASGPIVPFHSQILSEGRRIGRQEARAALANILVSNFGFKSSETQTLLSKSFLMLGLQSLDFILFSERVLSETGLVIPPSAFASESSLGETLDSLMN